MTLSRTFLPVIFISLLSLQGCAAVAVGAAAVGISSATDPRTIGTQVDDQTIELKANAKLGNDEQLEDARVVAISYDTNVLLVGQVPSEALKEELKRPSKTLTVLIKFSINCVLALKHRQPCAPEIAG